MSTTSKALPFLVVGLLVGALLTAGSGGPTGSTSRRGGEEQAGGGPAPAGAVRARVLDPPDPRTLPVTAAGAGATGEGTGATAAGSRWCEDEEAEGVMCAHGSEPPPAGVDVSRLPTIEQLRDRRFGDAPTGRARASAGEASYDDARTAGSDSAVVTPEEVASPGEVACVGDGTSGPRVQAIYAHAADVRNRYTEVLPLIRRYAADVNTRINLAAGRSGQGRVVRFVTTGSPCVLDVRNVTLPPEADDTFARSVGALRQLGFARNDRKYLVWMDAAVGICGVGHVYTDDRPTSDNLNARGDMFARTDAPCWGYAELHELLHTLGAVQDSAQHATGAGHCVDQTDTMCYSDTSGAQMRQLCTNAPEWNVDCQLNDYFNAAPPPGSYLDTHWNTADSPYLASTSPPPPAPVVTVNAPARAYAGNPVSVSADIRLAPGTDLRDLTWTSSRPDCRFGSPGARTTRFWCPVTAAGGARLTVWVTDSNRTQTSATHDLRLTVPSRRRAVALTLTSSSASVRAGRTVALRGTLTDRATGKVVIGMPVALYRRPSGSTGWQKVTTRSTGVRGQVRFVVRPRRTTDYLLASGYTSTWAAGTSPGVRVRVRG